MNVDVVPYIDLEKLREQAESTLRESHAGASLPAQESFESLYHELQVHHIELRMQNEELRRSERELRRSSEAYRALFESAPSGYVVLDREGRCLDCNARAAFLLGLTADQLRGRPLAAFFAGHEAADQLHLRLADVYERGHTPSWLLREATHTAAAALQVDMLQVGLAGDPPTCLVALTDVSVLHRALDDIIGLEQGLEQAVDGRTLELKASNERLAAELAERRYQEDQLVEARKLDAVARLAGGVAHEFNNQLTVIRLELDLLARSELNGGLRNIEAIRAALDHSAALTLKLLTFARREPSGGAPRDLAFTLNQMRAALRHRLPERIGFEIRVKPLAAWVTIGEIETELLVDRLISNAIDAIDATGGDGAGRVELELDTVELNASEAARIRNGRAGRFVRLAVSDTGCGITAEQQRLIFDPFYTSKKRSNSAGLGLSEAHGIVAAARGFIDVVSSPGAGTRFALYFPRVAAPQRAARPASGLLREAGEGAGGARCVLVIDDNPALRAAASRVLAGEGYETVSAADASEALKIMATRGADVDLVLCDVVMPGMLGTELFQRLHALWPNLPVILTSGSSSDDSIPPGAHFLPKPFKPDDLMASVRAATQAPSAPGGT